MGKKLQWIYSNGYKLFFKRIKILIINIDIYELNYILRHLWIEFNFLQRSIRWTRVGSGYLQKDVHAHTSPHLCHFIRKRVWKMPRIYYIILHVYFIGVHCKSTQLKRHKNTSQKICGVAIRIKISCHVAPMTHSSLEKK